MNKRNILITLSIAAVVIILSLPLLFAGAKTLDKANYLSKIDAVIEDVLSGKLTLEDNTYFWKSEGCDAAGYGCVKLEANEDNSQFKAYINSYECSRSANDSKWDCMDHM